MIDNSSPSVIERISVKHMLGVLMGILNLERGIFLAMWMAIF